jgi:hypothetical protein
MLPIPKWAGVGGPDGGSEIIPGKVLNGETRRVLVI